VQEKKSDKRLFYYWLLGLLLSILLMINDGVANPFVCIAIISSFGSGWYGAKATLSNK